MALNVTADVLIREAEREDLQAEEKAAATGSRKR